MIAALYVLENGPYYGIEDVDPWPEARDARTYDGPWPVVAHPPCARWGRYWSGGPSHHGKYLLPSDDGGCFAAALHAVLTWGGILEHPEGSLAWPMHAIPKPPRGGGWAQAGRGWTCCVEQGHYGHRAAKRTWLFAAGVDPPELRWGPTGKRLPGADGNRQLIRRGVCERLSKRQRAETPLPFRDLLLSIARAALAALPQEA